jgi:peptidoglycan/LPS O-acetylase OafA/YrhL
LPDSWSLAQQWALVKNPFALFAHFLMGVLAADLFLVFQTRASKKTTTHDEAHSRFSIADAMACMCGVLIVAIEYPGRWRLESELHISYYFPFFHLLVVFFLVALPFSRYAGRILDSAFLRLTGTLSFGIYLWHDLIIFALKRSGLALGQPQTIGQAILSLIGVLALSYMVAALSYVLVERPVLRRAQSYGRSPRTSAGPVGLQTLGSAICRDSRGLD